MNKNIKIILLSLLLAGCNLNIIDSSSNNKSSSTNSVNKVESTPFSNVNEESSKISNISSSRDSSTSSKVSSLSTLTSSTISSNSSLEESSSSSSNSSSSLSSSSSSENKETLTISSIKEEAKKYKGLENSVGVYESNYYVEIDLTLIACLDAITTKSGYGDRYKILMSDGNDYIYIKTKQENYTYLKNYVEDRGVYTVKGYISLYNNEVELTVSEKPTYLSNKTIDINYETLAAKDTLENIYNEMYDLKLNCKGIAFSKIVAIDVVCLAKDINNTNLYFGNGSRIINVHGSDKVTNKFVVGSSYTLYGALNMHNFRPGLEYVHSVKLDSKIEFNTDDAKEIKAEDFYKYKYETDKDASYPNYSKLFEYPYVIKGYANSYTKDNKEYVVFEDKYNTNYYSTYQNAMNAKAVFFVNENYIKLTASNSKYCPMYEHIDAGTNLETIIFPYLWNTQKYPQVYCYSFNEI